MSLNHDPDNSAFHHGISVRDYFAAKAMQALVVQYSGQPSAAADLAYKFADAMLAKRRRDEHAEKSI